MNWKDPKVELPKDKSKVAVLIYYSKECWPLSAEIYFGEAEYLGIDEEGNKIFRVVNCDFIGGGLSQWCFYDQPLYSKIDAWAYSDEFPKPEFLKHDPHWGKYK